MTPGLPPEAEAHYRRYDEDDRLQRHWIERVRTQQVLARLLPEPVVVLDVGGGTGVHARWLAEQGHDVTLVDAMAEHVERATADGSYRARVGDARTLEEEDGSVDAVLLLGPLYHLTEVADRGQALGEAHRVLRPGGALVAGAVTYTASLLDGVVQAHLDDPRFVDIVRADLATGQHRNPTGDEDWFTTTFFHRPDELRAEVEAAGFAVEELLGVEGPGWMVGEPERSLVAAELADAHPELAVLSAHLLAVGRRR
ncbi:MAG TPA: methyltransferase domain-containing protein [Acidimicrobiales bacterium]|nr:methyltransferase domain-containing protein [Acidimicrobiales bacterium]